jgi:hypothetical protein
MSKQRENIPQADTLMGAMRSMGYSFEAALADVIDNSISAHASTIRVLFPTTPMESLAVGVLDDGIGMSSNALYEAMRYGSTSSESVRDVNDLGRFGLGLKSASLSQCRVLTVVSCWEGKSCGFKWDYNYIQQMKQWYVLELLQKECRELPYFEQLKEQGKGTLVLWTDFDILSKANDGQVYNALNDYKEIVSKHISLIFHRFMGRSRGKISMYVNNQKLKPLDPFLESHPKTTTLKEKNIAVIDSNGKEQQIKIRPFILPYLSDMSKKDKELIGGVEDMRTKQGFYVYRNERLIIWGNWFGMTRRNELTKNARIRVDIPNSLDDIWSIDVKKQVAKIPKRIQNQLTKMVNDALGISVSKQTHRGRKQNVDENIDYIWDRIEGRDKNFYYKVNRDSELFKFVFSRLAEEDVEYVKMLVSEIEKNVPMQQIYLDKSNDSIIVEEDEHREDEVYQMAITMIDASKAISPSPVSKLIDNFLKSEPFCKYEQLNDRLKEYYYDEIK